MSSQPSAATPDAQISSSPPSAWRRPRPARGCCASCSIGRARCCSRAHRPGHRRRQGRGGAGPQPDRRARAGRRGARRGERRPRRRRGQGPLHRRPSRRHHQLRARHPALRLHRRRRVEGPGGGGLHRRSLPRRALPGDARRRRVPGPRASPTIMPAHRPASEPPERRLRVSAASSSRTRSSAPGSPTRSARASPR